MHLQDFIEYGSALGLGSAVPWAFRTARSIASDGRQVKLSRIENLEELVDALRRALDKGRLREDALAQVLGVLIFGLKHVEDLSPPISDAIERAIEILEGAQDRLLNIHREGSHD